METQLLRDPTEKPENKFFEKALAKKY